MRREECLVPTADADFSGVGFQVFGRNQALSRNPRIRIAHLAGLQSASHSIFRLADAAIVFGIAATRSQDPSLHAKEVTRIKLFKRLRRAESTENKIIR